MRLIDADKIEYTSIAHLASYPVAPSPCDTVMRAEINAMPTVDVVPVRHGRWIPEAYDDMFCYCSECGTHEYKETIEVLHYDYCPYCGAKMDAEKEEK